MSVIDTISLAVEHSAIQEAYDLGQMSIHSLIGTLQGVNQNYEAFLGHYEGGSPGDLSSYRGYYDHLAICPSNDLKSVRQFREELQGVIDTQLGGYKGGLYKMRGDTPVWVAPYGLTGKRVVGVEVLDGLRSKDGHAGMAILKLADD